MDTIKYYECKKCPHNCATFKENNECLPEHIKGKKIPQWEEISKEDYYKRGRL